MVDEEILSTSEEVSNAIKCEKKYEEVMKALETSILELDNSRILKSDVGNGEYSSIYSNCINTLKENIPGLTEYLSRKKSVESKVE